MFAEFKHTLRRLRGQIIGWSVGLALYTVLMAGIYEDIAQIDMNAMLEYYPAEMMAFFGDAIQSLNTPWGYLDTYFFNYMTIILGIFVVGACAGLLVGDEERGILDLVLAHPVSRSSLFLGRLLGFTTALILILAVCWLCWVLPSGSTGMDLTWIEFLRPFVSLVSPLLLFGMLALLLSMLLPASKVAGMVTGGLLVGNYLVVGLANINEDLKAIVEYTPLHFYQGGKAVTSLNWGWFGGLMAVAVLLTLAAWLFFQRRDIRVGGEGGWRMPVLGGRAKRA